MPDLPRRKAHIKGIKESQNNNTVAIDIDCPICHGVTTQMYPLDGYNKWVGGQLMQHAMPDVDSDQREQLVSGVCPACFEKTFGAEE